MWKEKGSERRKVETRGNLKLSHVFFPLSVPFALRRDDPGPFIPFFSYVGSECFTFTQCDPIDEDAEAPIN